MPRSKMKPAVRSKISKLTKSKTAHILKLSDELLEHLMSYCVSTHKDSASQNSIDYDPTRDLRNLRMTCKRVEAAALKEFVKYHVARVRCSMVDDNPIMRIHELMEMRSLISKIKSVELTLEEDTDVHHEHRSQDGVGVSEQCQCGSWEVHRESWDLIESIIKRLGQQKDATLRLDFAWERWTSVPIRPAPQKSTLLRNKLRLARSAGCSVEQFYMSDRFEADCTDAFPLGSDGPALFRHLEKFAYVSRPSKEEDVEDQHIVQQLEIVKRIDRDGHALKHFELHVTPWRELRRRRNQSLMDLSGDLLSGAQLSALETTWLVDLQTTSSNLIKLFTRCPQATLQGIDLVHLHMFDETDGWAEVFQKLKGFKALQRIVIQDLDLRFNGRRYFVEFIVPERGLEERRSETDGIDVNPTQFFEINVEKGLDYSIDREPQPV